VKIAPALPITTDAVRDGLAALARLDEGIDRTADPLRRHANLQDLFREVSN
jgi:hypothetical protein